MGVEQAGIGAGATAQGAEPWRRAEARGVAGGPMKLIYLTRQAGGAPDPEALAQVGIALHQQVGEIATLAENSPLLSEADVFVVEVVPTDPASLDAFDRLIHLTAGNVAVIAAVEGLTVGATRTLLRAGALDVLPVPFTAEELKQAVEPARRPARPAGRLAPQQRRQGKVVAIMGALGGVGTTSITVQLGAAWAASSRVGLIDLDLQFGASALYLNLHPSLTIANLIEDAERLDTELLQSVAMKHSSSLEVLASPADIMPMDMVAPEFVDQLMRTATQVYDVVLVDMPQAWTEWSVRVLQRADIILMVTNLSVPGVYQARRQLELIDANGLAGRLRILANRVSVSFLGRKASTKETEAVLGRKIDFTVSNDYPGMSAAGDEGVVLKDAGASSRLIKDIRELAAQLSEALAAEAVPQ